MCLTDLLTQLRNLGVGLSEAQIRWAIKTGKISRPPLDGSLRFDFAETHLLQLRQLADQGRMTNDRPKD